MIAHADNVTLTDVRTSVIASGVIPDTYLIEPTGTYWDSNNATTIYNFFKTWTEAKNESVPSNLFQNKVNRALFNTATLLEGSVDSLHQVAALVTAKERALGTYNESGYLKKYHDHIISNHNIPNTASGIDTALSQALGDMTPLAGEITSIANRAASIAGIPNELLESDIEYWVDVEISTYCKLDKGANHTDCTPGNQTSAASDFILGAAPSVSANWYWRAIPCYGAVCSNTVSGSGSSTFDIRINGQTVTGSKIWSSVTVRNAPQNTQILTSISLNIGDRFTNEKLAFGSGTFSLSGYWEANNHPCYKKHRDDSSKRFQCLGSTTWTFRGTSKITIPTPPTDRNRDTDPPNQAPNIIIDTEKYADLGRPHVIDASRSSDPDGDRFSYRWTHPENTPLNSTRSAAVKFTAPIEHTDLVFTLTLTDEHNKSKKASITIPVNTQPTLTVISPPGYLMQYVGLFFGSDSTFPPYFLMEGKDTPGVHLDLYVETPPDRENAALVNCEETGFFHIYDTVYNKDWHFIRDGTTPVPATVCMVALNPVTNGKFVLTAFDGVRKAPETVTYTIRAPAETIILAPSDVAGIVPEAMKVMTDCEISCHAKITITGTQIVFILGEALLPEVLDTLTELWRCHQGHELPDTNCDYSGVAPDEPPGPLAQNSHSDRSTRATTDSSNGWEMIVTDTGDMVNTKSDVVFVVGQQQSDGDASSSDGLRSAHTTVDNGSRTLYDFGAEPGETYKYALRLTVNGTTSQLIPLGNITMPADTTPPLILLHGETEMTISSVYEEPGYNAVDNYDLVLTANVTVTGTVDTSTPGTYKLYYDVSDSSGNAAITQNRTVHVTDSTPPVITLKGQQAMTVEGRTTYVEPGYTAIDNVDGNVTDMVVVSGMVDTTILDTYTLRYDVSDSVGNAATQNRTVTVVDTTPPVITLIDGAEITVPASVPYIDPGYEAIDGMDGNITDRVKVVGTVNVDAQGLYQILYIVADSSGNLADTMIRNVIVTDMTPPVITLKGGSKVWVTKGMTYTEPGYTAIDNIDGNVTGMVVVTGMVDANTEGMYVLHYDITDRAGNAATTQNRTVTVVAGDASPVITLKGQRVMTIEEGTVYVEPGYTATDHEDGDLTASVTVTGTVDMTKIGTYTIYYDVSDSFGNAAIQQTRTIHVVDVTPPAIILVGPTDMTIQLNPTYTEPGYTATDNYDGDLTGNVVVTGTVDTTTTGTYTIYYDVADSSGNQAVQQVRTVHVGDVTPPVITLADPTVMTIQVNSAYAEPGYTATDDYDEDLTYSVIVTGTVDAAKIGTYTLYYDVSDSSDNHATQQVRTVHVVAITPPAITLSGSAVTIPFGSAYSEPGYTATDPEDGDLTSSVIVTGTVDAAKIGTYHLYYDVADRFGNKAVQQTRTVHVVDVTPPTITLAGQTNMTVPVNTTYADPGYTATDDYDGDLTGSVVVTGTVDAAKIGTYTIYYDVSDGSGNAAIQQVRTVHVEAIPDPQAGLPEVVKRYDADRNGSIDYPEWQRAISDYTNGLLTTSELYAISAARSYG